MDSFFGISSIEDMKSILSDDLSFEGPFHKFNSASDYYESLLENPPKDVKYILEESFENENSVCLVYLFLKSGIKTRMVQTFEISNGKISKIRLVFDTNAFK